MLLAIEAPEARAEADPDAIVERVPYSDRNPCNLRFEGDDVRPFTVREVGFAETFLTSPVDKARQMLASLDEERLARFQEFWHPRDVAAGSLLHLAVMNTQGAGHVEALLDHGFDIDKKDRAGMTALFRTSDSANLAATRLLLDRGADRTIENCGGSTLLRRCTTIQESGFTDAACAEILIMLED